MISILPSLFILGLAAVAALLLSRWRHSSSNQSLSRKSAAQALAVATFLQCLHFIEEALTGFHVEFPAVMGLPAMPFWFFLVFNLFCVACWIAAVPALSAGRSWAFFAAWFLAIAGTLNLLAHPLLALIVDGYFPGVYSSTFVGLACLWLWRQLHLATG